MLGRTYRLQVKVKDSYKKYQIESSFVPEVGTKIAIMDLNKKVSKELEDTNTKEFRIVDIDTLFITPKHDGLESSITLIVEEINDDVTK